MSQIKHKKAAHANSATYNPHLHNKQQHHHHHQNDDDPFDRSYEEQPPPRKDRDKQKQQHQKKKKKSSQHNDPSLGGPSSRHATSNNGAMTTASNGLKRSLAQKDSDQDDDDEDEEDETDISKNASKRFKKKPKKEATATVPTVKHPTTNSNSSSSTSTFRTSTLQTTTLQTTTLPTVTSSTPLVARLMSDQSIGSGMSNSNSKTKSNNPAPAPAHTGHRLILRLPNSRGPSPNPSITASAPSDNKPVKRKYVRKSTAQDNSSTTTSTSPATKNHPTTTDKPLQRKNSDKGSSTTNNHKGNNGGSASVLSSPLSSVDSDLADSTRKEGDAADAISDFELGKGLPVVNYDASFSSDSDSDHDFYDLSDDDDENVDVDDDSNIESEEERFLIADKMRKGRRSGRNSKFASPTLSNSHGQGITDEEDSLEMIGSHHLDDLAESQQGAVLLEIARLNRHVEESDHRHSDNPVTWSGAEDSGLDDLDELLGLTADDSAVILGEFDGSDTDDNKTMRFEDFLAQDDGDDESDSGSSCSSSSGNSSDDEASEGDFNDDHVDLGDIQSLTADTPRNDETDAEDEHLSISKDVVSQGGFVFYKTGASDESTEEEISEEEVCSENGGDTTDTLDDSDHLGLLRFGIEAADEDDEDAEEALAAARRDRNLIDARNMGLSISINALANHPKTVINKTARTLGVAPETAAKILTSVGMSILFNGGSIETTALPIEEEEEVLPRMGRGKQRLPPRPADMDEAPPASASAPGANKPSTADASSKVDSGRTLKPNAPILGDFKPAGEADLCVVISNDAPAPSPFSARKRRRTRRLTDGSGSPRRGQSVVSSISSRSVQSAPPYGSSSSEEPLYNVLLDLEELVDSRMLPSGMSDVSEEDDDMDDAASVSTAMGGIHSVGDVSRWNRIPIGAFRSQNRTYTSLATAIFSGSRDPAIANNLSFHGGVAVTNSKHRKKRFIPVSPVLFPVGQPLKSISNVKSRKDRRRERKQHKVKKEPPSSKTPKSYRHNHHSHHRAASAAASASSRRNSLHGGAESRPSTSMGDNDPSTLPQLPPPSISISSPFVVPEGPMPSLPSDGLSHYVSPLFSGVASGLQIPPLSL